MSVSFTAAAAAGVAASLAGGVRNRGSVGDRSSFCSDAGDDASDLFLFTSRGYVRLRFLARRTFACSRMAGPDAPTALTQAMLASAYALCAGAFTSSAAAASVRAWGVVGSAVHTTDAYSCSGRRQDGVTSYRGIRSATRAILPAILPLIAVGGWAGVRCDMCFVVVVVAVCGGEAAVTVSSV